MPFKLVLTKNGTNEEVSAVPEGWVVGTHLYWPRLLKKSEIESLRSNENSVPETSWKKIKCRLKLSGICSFKEALHLEDLYSKFQDTEDEEMYLNDHKNKIKQTTNILSKQLLDVDSEFDMDENNGVLNEISSEEVKAQFDKNNSKIMANSDEINVQASSSDQNNIQVIYNDVQGTSANNDEIITINANELYKIIQENNSLQTENKALKEEIVNSVEFQNETKKNFAIMQTQLDKVIDLLQSKSRAISSIVADDGLSTSKDGINNIIIGNLKFPIETKEQLDELEYKLLEKDVMSFLVKKFSETCGTSGMARISKVGLPLMKRFIKDELLNQFTWKGIKGSTKMSFVQYVKIRELFYMIAHLADKSCSFSDADSFIQNSAIKHSGQRIKRHILSSESKFNVKRTKKEINIIENDKQRKEEEINIIENEMDKEKYDSEKHRGLKNNKERKDDNNSDVNDEIIGSSNTEISRGSILKKETDDFKNATKITVLSDVKVTNKELGINNGEKIANITSVNANSLFDDLMNFSPYSA